MTVTRHQAIAIESFVLKTTIPIFFDADKEHTRLATGTLFEACDRSFLLTARHILDNVSNIAELSYPESPNRGPLHTLGSSQALIPKNDNIDVVAIELKCQDTVQRLKSTWKFLTPENVIHKLFPKK